MSVRNCAFLWINFLSLTIILSVWFLIFKFFECISLHTISILNLDDHHSTFISISLNEENWIRVFISSLAFELILLSFPNCLHELILLSYLKNVWFAFLSELQASQPRRYWQLRMFSTYSHRLDYNMHFERALKICIPKHCLPSLKWVIWNLFENFDFSYQFHLC